MPEEEKIVPETEVEPKQVEGEPAAEIDEDFADAHPYVPPVVEEEQKEEEPKPVDEDEEPLPDEPEEEQTTPEDIAYDDQALEDIENARLNWHSKFKKRSRLKTIISIIALLLILAAWLVPTLLIRNQGLVPMYIGLGAAIVGALGLFVYNALNRKKDQQLIHEYFVAYYDAVNRYTLLGNGIESYEGKVEDKVSQEEFNAPDVFPEAKQIGSRDNVVFTYQGMDCALADAAAQKDGGQRGLTTAFVGKYLRSHNTLDITEEGITIYFRGNSRALVPASLSEKTLLEKNKYIRIYGDSANKKILTDNVRSALKEVHTNRLLVDATIVLKPGKTYFFLGYEDDIMVLPNDKPFNPKFVKQYKGELKTFLEIALLFHRP